MNKNVLVAGCGSIGKRHASLLSMRPDVNLWLCDPVQKNIDDVCKELKASKTFNNYQDALKERPDFVWICTPESLHSAMAIEALKLDMNIFCEKPITDNLDAAENILAALKTSKGKMAVGYVLRYSKAYSSIKELLNKNTLGNVVSAEVSLGAYDTLTCAKSDFYLKQPWSLVLTYTHELDYLRWFLGPVKNIIGFSNTLGDMDKKPSPNVVGAVLHFEQGPIATLMMDYVRSPGGRAIRITGDKGTLYYSSENNEIAVSLISKPSVEKISINEERNASFIREHDNFFNYVEGKESVIISAEDATETIRTAYKLIRYLNK